MFLKSSVSCQLVNMFVRGGTNRGDFDGPEPKPVLGFQISAMKSPPKASGFPAPSPLLLPASPLP